MVAGPALERSEAVADLDMVITKGENLLPDARLYGFNSEVEPSRMASRI